MEAASRKSGRVEKEKEGPPESLLAFYFYFFVFLFSFFYNETDAWPDSPLRSFPFFVFSEISFFWRRRQRSSRIWFPKSFELSCFFPPAYFYIFGEKGDLERIPSSLSRTILPFLHNLLFHLRFALWSYIAIIAFPIWHCKIKLWQIPRQKKR